MAARAEEHAAYEVRGRDGGRALDDLEAASRLDEAVAVLARRVGRDVVAVDDVLAAEVGDPGEVGHVGCVGNGLCDPSAGVDGGNTVAVRCCLFQCALDEGSEKGVVVVVGRYDGHTVLLASLPWDPCCPRCPHQSAPQCKARFPADAPGQ